MTKILLIDDDIQAMRYYVETLEAAGFDVTQCTGPDSALQVLRDTTTPVSAVLLDIMMPPGDAYRRQNTQEGLTTGLFLLEDLRRLRPNLPVVVLTNVSNRDTLQRIPRDSKLLLIPKVACPPHALLEEITTRLGLVPERSGEEEPALLRELHDIPPGAEHASVYHDCIFRVLSQVFAPQLSAGQKETRIHEGRKRIDIVYRNTAESGFFADLFIRHGLKCPYVFFECKNYAEDPRNPELDQLAGRFSDKRGQFGMIVCRAVTSRERLVQRCRDIVADNRGYILVLDDADITKLFRMRLGDEEQGITHHLHEMLRGLLL
jgi:CheY-like chemotaxis protein